MLHKCANPVWCAQFRYLHQGKLFEVEVQYLAAHQAIVNDNRPMARSRLRGGGYAIDARHTSLCILIDGRAQ